MALKYGSNTNKELIVGGLPVVNATIAVVPDINSVRLEGNNTVSIIDSAIGTHEFVQPERLRQGTLVIDDNGLEKLNFRNWDGMRMLELSVKDMMMSPTSDDAMSFMFVANLKVKAPQTQWAWNEGDRQVNCQLMTNATGKITIVFNDNAGGKWEKDNTALVADTVSAVFCERLGDSVEVWVNGVSEGVQIITSSLNTQWATGAVATSSEASELKNLALWTSGLMEVTTDVTSFHDGDVTRNLRAATDGVTGGGLGNPLSYACHPKGANGKYIEFKIKDGTFMMDSLVFWNRNDYGANTTVTNRILGSRIDYWLRGELIATELMDTWSNAHTHKSTWQSTKGIELDRVTITFSGDNQNFREIEIFGTKVTSSRMVGVPDTGLTVGADHQRHNHAWAEAAEQRGETQTLTLSYGQSVYVKHVVIREVFNPGSISSLEVLNGAEWVTVYTRSGTVGADGIIANPIENGGRMFNFTAGKVSDTTIELNKITDYRCKKIRLKIGNNIVHYNEVDAVQIAGYSSNQLASLKIGYDHTGLNPSVFGFYGLFIYPRLLDREEKSKMFLFTKKRYGV